MLKPILVLFELPGSLLCFKYSGMWADKKFVLLDILYIINELSHNLNTNRISANELSVYISSIETRGTYLTIHSVSELFNIQASGYVKISIHIFDNKISNDSTLYLYDINKSLKSIEFWIDNLSLDEYEYISDSAYIFSSDVKQILSKVNVQLFDPT